MGKIIGGVVAALVIIIAIVVGVVYFNLDKIIIAAVEEYGSEVTQSEVSLNEVDIDMTSGKGGLRGLTVGNPSGFEEPNAFELGEIAVEVNIADTSGELIHITSIKVDAPRVVYELKEGGNNLDALKKNVDDYVKAMGGSESSSSEEGEGPKLIIDSLVIQGGKVVVKAPITMNKSIEGNLPTITLKDIGKEEGGADPGEVAAKIIESITAGSMSVIGDLGVGKTLQSLQDGLGSVTKGVTDGAAGAASGASKAVEGVGGAVKGLLGGSSD
ncbi:hypothetical protein [Sneathiella limimaris]|uniref:hypothetical protein n=1 Tax=Sneathiella limimaris TaxID=1964213 RepID=UPI00146C92DB|nr:hypothetical protein [Sneathiella limimaris]